MKACPFCEAELRNSVIKCTRCGRSLLGEPEQSPARQPAAAGATGLGAPTVSGGTRGTKAGFPPPESAPPVQRPNPWAPAATSAPAASPGTELSPQHLSTLRALPGERRRSGKPDVALWLSALATLGAAALAWQSIRQPWVRLVITDTSDHLDPKLVGDVTLHGHAALVGIMGQALAVLLGVYGLLWLVYGFDRGSTVPWFANPASAIVASVAGLVGTVTAAMVWFVWKDAAVEHARAVKMTADELRALLDLQPAPLVEIERLTGILRFGGAMVIGLLAACTAWWCCHKRG